MHSSLPECPRSPDAEQISAFFASVISFSDP
jgi:hypothetical protein